jgi:formylglycine-generating enzyme required for sulfatase activity
MASITAKARGVFLFSVIALFSMIGCEKQGEPAAAHPHASLGPASSWLWGEDWTLNQNDPNLRWTYELYEHTQEDARWGLKQRAPDTSGMALIPAGSFVIGFNQPSPTHWWLQQQRRTVGAFYIDRTETTQADYARCVAEHQCLPVRVPTGIGEAPNNPTVLPYLLAERYCYWVGKRLPTEYEWEAAARGADGRLYPWGNEPPTPLRANICGAGCPFSWADPNWNDGSTYLAPVDSFPAGASPYGLLNMAGNVREWVTTDQPLDPEEYIARGASWYSPREELFAYSRQPWRPGMRVDDKGVRCAADAR